MKKGRVLLGQKIVNVKKDVVLDEKKSTKLREFFEKSKKN